MPRVEKIDRGYTRNAARSITPAEKETEPLLDTRGRDLLRGFSALADAMAELTELVAGAPLPEFRPTALPKTVCPPNAPSVTTS
jgi:hypothetical protein